MPLPTQGGEGTRVRGQSSFEIPAASSGGAGGQVGPPWLSAADRNAEVPLGRTVTRAAHCVSPLPSATVAPKMRQGKSQRAEGVKHIRGGMRGQVGGAPDCTGRVLGINAGTRRVPRNVTKVIPSCSQRSGTTCSQDTPGQRGARSHKMDSGHPPVGTLQTLPRL